MDPLDLAIQLSDLFEATETEYGIVAHLIDEAIVPTLHADLKEANGIGLGQRFASILDRVQGIIGQSGSDDVRALKEMMKNVLTDYVKRTKDTVTGRHIFHHAIMGGKDTMLTVTSAGLLANALAGQHPREAMQMMQQIGRKLTGERPMAENASSAAVGAGAVAVSPKRGKKTRKSAFFAENLAWNDLLEGPQNLDILREIAAGTENYQVEGVLVDPTTAELVLATHIALSPDRKRRYESKTIAEMVRIAYSLHKMGGIEVVMEET